MIIDANALFGANADLPMDFPSELLGRLMEAHGIDQALVYSLVGLRSDTRLATRQALDLARRDTRFIPAGCINPIVYFDLHRQILDFTGKGVRFFRIFPETNNYPLQPYPPLQEVFEALEESGAALVCAITKPGTASELSEATAAYSFPVIMVEAGYACMAEAIWVCRQSPRFYLETSRVSSAYGIETLVSEIGADRILYGSQAPRNYYGSSLFMVNDAQIDEQSKAHILGGNFQALIERSGK